MVTLPPRELVKPRAAYSSEAFGVTPGRDTGASTRIVLTYDELPAPLDVYYNNYYLWNGIDGTLADIAYVLEYLGAYPIDGMGTLIGDYANWYPVIRNMVNTGDSYEYTFTNDGPDYQNIIPKMVPGWNPIGTLSDFVKSLSSTSYTILPIDPQSLDSIKNFPYYPALYTANLLDWMRTISASLGMPILDIFTNFVLFAKHVPISNKSLLSFQRNWANPGPPQDSVRINWNEVMGIYDDADNQPFVLYELDNVISIGSGETQEISVKVNGNSGNYVNPTIVSSIPKRYIDGDLNVGDNPSIYCVTGADGYVVSPARWSTGGGSITVKPGEGAFDLTITIVAPDDPGIAPFTITEGADRPSLYIGSTSGVLTRPRTTTVTLDPARIPGWGVENPQLFDEVDVEPATIDMPLIDSEANAYSALLRYANSLYAPQLTCQGTMQVTEVGIAGDANTPDRTVQTVNGTSIPLLPTKKFYRDNSMWRITSVDWNVDQRTVSFEGEDGTTIEDFNDNFGPALDVVTTDDSWYVKRRAAGGVTTIAEFNALADQSGIGTCADLRTRPLFTRPVDMDG